MRTSSKILFALMVLVVTNGCASVLSLRKDFDDSETTYGPVVGGQWAERGFLSESMSEGGPYSDRTIGHQERAPASMAYGEPGGARDGWINRNQADANLRDSVRGGEEAEEVTFNNTPNLQPSTKRLYKNGMRATRADFIDESPNEGSLWASDGQTNYYFTKNKIRGIGDIVTVKTEDDLIRDMGLEIRRGLLPMEKARELGLAQERIRSKFTSAGSDTVASSAAAPDRAPAGSGDAAKGQAAQADNKKAAAKPIAAGDIPQATLADIDVAKGLEIKAGDPILAEIVERYPNGNYKIRGTKRVAYRNGSPRLVTLLGVVRGADIGEDDTVTSGKLYEYRLEAIR